MEEVGGGRTREEGRGVVEGGVTREVTAHRGRHTLARVCEPPVLPVLALLPRLLVPLPIDLTRRF